MYMKSMKLGHRCNDSTPQLTCYVNVEFSSCFVSDLFGMADSATTRGGLTAIGEAVQETTSTLPFDNVAVCI
jgi:hypothetical protein